MDIKEYIKLIKSQKIFFFTIIFSIVLVINGYFYLRPVSYDTSLILNITRIGKQETQDFKYDNFYRLQADEKFTETLVQWLKSPRVNLDIFEEAGFDMKGLSLKKLSKAIHPEKMSAQMVLVNYSTSTPEASKKISQSIIKTINARTEQLNKEQQDETWFMVLAGEPVTVKSSVDLFYVFFASLALGVFLSFWAVMVRHYLK